MIKPPALILALSIILALPAHADTTKKVVKVIDFTKTSPYSVVQNSPNKRQNTSLSTQRVKPTATQKKTATSNNTSPIVAKTNNAKKTEKKNNVHTVAKTSTTLPSTKKNIFASKTVTTNTSKTSTIFPSQIQNDQNIRQSLIAAAKKLIGVPYRWGGMTPKGFDCSGLVSYLFKQKGKSLPRTAAAQFASLTAVKNPQPGDLVFFRHKSGRIGHVGLYIGAGKMIHAPQTGKRVRIESIEKPNWQRRYAGARSLLPRTGIQIADSKGSGNVGQHIVVK